MSNKKKIIIICSMVVLLVVAGYLNVILNKNSDSDVDNTDDGTVSTFFSEYRTDRESARAEQIAYLDAVIQNTASTDEAKTSAETMKLDLIEVMETELVLEGLIKAKGFEDVVVTMSTNNINVIVMDEELVSDEVAQILNVITQETGYSASKVVIVPYSTEEAES